MQQRDIINRDKGFFTFAQNSEDTNYVRLAYVLAMSLKLSQKTTPYLSIGITPDTNIPKQWEWAFDNIIEIPWGDDAISTKWKLANEWKAIHMSPYAETIKLDCDMLFFKDITQVWDSLSNTDISICNKVLSYRSDVIVSDHYRKAFTVNKLPNVYTAMTYFKKHETAYMLFDIVKDIFENWEIYSKECTVYDYRPEYPTTDVAFAIALKILDLDSTHYTENDVLKFVHMKSHLQGWDDTGLDENWSTHITALINGEFECKIGNHLQIHPLHYHIKSFITTEIIEQYERYFK